MNEVDAQDIIIRNLKEKEQVEQEKKQKILDALISIMNKIKVKVPNLHSQDLSKIDKNNLEDEMRESMVTHSHLIDDIFQMSQAVADMKALRNSLMEMLHFKFKFKNKNNLKTSKEVQTYIDADMIFNQVNLQIRKVEAQIEKSKELSSIIKSKIGFIRDITKLKTQELFGDSNG